MIVRAQYFSIKSYFILLLVIITQFVNNKSYTQNPFDIEGRSVDTLESSTSDTISLKNSIGGDSMQKPNSANKGTLFAEENYLKLKESNPFEVSHIPLAIKKTATLGQIEIKIKPKISNTFIFWIMLFSWALLGLVLGNRRDILPKLLQSIFNENMLKLIKKQDGERLNLHFVIMYIVFFINASVFIYLISKEYGGLTSTKNWFFLLLIIIAIYITRHTVLSLMAWIFPIDKELSLFSFLIMVLNLILGLFLIPVNLVLAFGNNVTFLPSMVIGLVIISIFIIIRYFRGFFIGVNYAFNNLFLFFVYLCALEIAPVLIGIRLIKQFL